MAIACATAWLMVGLKYVLRSWSGGSAFGVANFLLGEPEIDQNHVPVFAE